MKTLFAIVVIIGIVTFAAIAGDPGAADRWPSFRGPGGGGISPARSVPERWDVEKNENVRWKVEVPGAGHSCPVVWGDRIFLTTAVRSGGEGSLKTGLYGDITPVADDAEHSWEVLAFDRGTGKTLWREALRKGIPQVKRHPKSTHANSTPAVDGKRVVAFFGSEGLYALDLDGRLLWKADLGLLDSGFFVAPGAQWGFGSSPVLHEDRVIVQCDVLNGSFLAALDATTGREVWRTRRDEVPTWSTPTVDLREGRGQIVVNGFRHIGGFDLATGREVWRLRGGGDIPVPTPILAGGLIIITNAHGAQSPIYAVRAGATGDITPPEGASSGAHLAWSHRRYGSYMPSPIALGDLVYLAGDAGTISCFRLETGEIAGRRRIGGAITASPVAAAGKIIVTTEEGTAHVLREGTGLEEISACPLGEECLATPAVAEGSLFFRTRRHLISIMAEGSAPGAPRGGPSGAREEAPAGDEGTSAQPEKPAREF